MTEYPFYFIKYNLTDIFHEDINIEKYSCPICFDSIDKKEIYQCKEGHWFCKPCWVESLSKKKECMICRDTINSISDLSRNRYLEQDFLNKKVFCPNSFKYVDENNFNDDNKNNNHYNSNNNSNNNNNNKIKDLENGCKDILTIGEIEKHLKQCKFTHIKCKFIGCNKILRLNKVEQHEKEQCEFRLEYCRYCDTDGITSRSLENHYKECPKFIVKCSENGCTVELERSQLQEHIEKQCQMVLIDCPYIVYGCESSNRFPRSKLTHHFNTINHTLAMGSMIEHQSLQIKETNNRYDNLLNRINKLEQLETESKCDQLYDKIYQLESKITKQLNNLEVDFGDPKDKQEQINIKFDSLFEKISKFNSFFQNCSLLKYKNRWSISNYLVESKRHKKITSPSFNIYDKKFQLVIYPQGNEEDGYIAIFLKSDSITPIKVFYKFILINRKDETKNIVYKNKSIIDKEKSTGYDFLLKSFEPLKKPESWLKEDSLIIDFSIEININNDIKPLES
ncbi:hypothetical protein ACTFIV_001126 [Dictyostelium citrinum]